MFGWGFIYRQLTLDEHSQFNVWACIRRHIRIPGGGYNWNRIFILHLVHLKPLSVSASLRRGHYTNNARLVFSAM